MLPPHKKKQKQNRRKSSSRSHNPSVSALSKFDDLIWDFSSEISNPSYTAADRIIRWDFDLGKGKHFSDPKFASLMLSCKQLFWATLQHPEGRSKHKPNTVTHRWRLLRPFVVFLVRRAFPILRFKDVPRHVVDEYLKTLRLPNRRGKKRENGALYAHHSVLRLLYIYRRKISDALQFDPFDGESPAKALNLPGTGAQSKTECIPDVILHKLISSALDYLRYSEYLIEADAMVEQILLENPREDGRVIFRHIERRLTEIAHLEVSGDVSFSLGVLTRLAIAKHLVRLRSACFILIAFITGMRLSELLSLEEGCVERELTDDGEFIWINSYIHKTLGGEVVKSKWLCGPEAAKAVSVLERLTASLRSTTGCPRLFIPVIRRLANAWKARAANDRTLGASAITDALKEYVEWLDLRDDSGRLFNLHAHMFRRTFARHVVRSDTTNLLALKDHFKHVSLAMTDYYVGVDEELQDLLNDEATRLGLEAFDKALRSDRLGGPRGKELVRQIDSAMADGRLPSEFRGEAGTHLRWKMIYEWVDAGQQIYPCGSGNVCWFREGSAMCTNGDRPVVEVCNPVGCANSVILPEHAPHWRSIEERAEELLRLNSPGEPYRQRLYTITKIAKKVRKDIS